MNNPCGLYIHIPFCETKCLYCDFFSKPKNADQINTYVHNLLKIIPYYAKRYKNKTFDTIYIGGGTPSIIGTQNLVNIISKIKECFNIISPEITIEMNPNSAQLIDFEKLIGLGVNRISLGVQSSDEQELKLLGRTHNNADVISAVNKIKNAGIDNISLDLIIGISKQTKQSLMKSIDFCIECGAKHISAYILKVEDNTPYKRLAPTLNLPDEDEQAEFYELMQDYLNNKGYNQYEISNFALKGFESRHNLKYWSCDEYLGLGASAHSMMNGERFYFPRSLADFYDNKIQQDGVGATPQEYIMLRLRLNDGIFFDQYEKIFDSSFPKRCIEIAEKYSKYNLTRVTEFGISLTNKGFLVSNSIISEMLAGE